MQVIKVRKTRQVYHNYFDGSNLLLTNLIVYGNLHCPSND